MRRALSIALATIWLTAACATIAPFSFTPVGGDASVEVDAAISDAGTVSDGGVADVRLPSDARIDDADAALARYHMFATVESKRPGEFRPGLSGIAAADAWCQSLGENVNAKSRWLAFLNTGAASARSRLSPASKTFYRVEKVGVLEEVIFDDIRDVNASPKIAIHAVNGEPLVGDAGDSSVRVWIGGSDVSQQCSPLNGPSWSTSANDRAGSHGIGSALDGTWEGRGSSYSISCSTPARIYCFEQDPSP